MLVADRARSAAPSWSLARPSEKSWPIRWASVIPARTRADAGGLGRADSGPGVEAAVAWPDPSVAAVGAALGLELVAELAAGVGEGAGLASGARHRGAAAGADEEGHDDRQGSRRGGQPSGRSDRDLTRSLCGRSPSDAFGEPAGRRRRTTANPRATACSEPPCRSPQSALFLILFSGTRC